MDGPVVLFTPTPVAPVEGLEVQLQAPLRQMIFADVPQTFKAAFDPLGAADVSAMLELTALTKPSLCS